MREFPGLSLEDLDRGYFPVITVRNHLVLGEETLGAWRTDISRKEKSKCSAQELLPGFLAALLVLANTRVCRAHIIRTSARCGTLRLQGCLAD